MKRYEPYLYVPKQEDVLAIDLINSFSPGLNFIQHNINHEQQQANKSLCDRLYGIVATIDELFDITNLYLNISNKEICFSLETDTNGYDHKGMESPRLSRELITPLSDSELAGVIIDLILDREQWNRPMVYNYVMG